MRFSRPSLRLVAALILAVPTVACTVVEGRQNVAEYVDDSTITNTIRARYIDDPRVHFGDVGVTTMNGVVHLSGRVNSWSERARAAQIASGVRGVKRVDNDIIVR